MNGLKRPEAVHHPRALRIAIACWLAAVSWVELAVVVTFLILGLVTRKPALGTPFMLALGLFVGTVVVYVLVALPIRCTTCSRRLLVETLGPKATGAHKRGKLDYWATSVVDVLLSRLLTCMYCGAKYRLKERSLE
jgi:DNA-directed RNA polymerase subunit RPC12/RpoP